MKRNPVLAEEVSALELANLVGLSTRSVRDWAARGVFVRGDRHGTFRTVESIRNYAASLREQAELSLTESGRTLADEKTEAIRIGRQIREFKLAQIKGEVLTLAEIDEAWTRISAALNRTMLAMPAAARAAIPHLTDHDEGTMMRVASDKLLDLAKEAEGVVGVKDTKEFGVLPND